MDTPAEIFAQRDRMEREAALALGELLFAFGHLELNTALAAVWAGRSGQFEERAARLDGSGFHLKCEVLREYVAANLADEALQAYLDWLDRADAVRRMRNKLVHERWGMQHFPVAAVCVSGYPFSEDQTATAYSAEDLQEIVASIRVLNSDLGKLHHRWPL